MRVAALALLLALGRVGGEACGGDALLEVHEELDHGDVCRSVRDRSSWSCPADCAPAEGREAPYCVNGHGAPCRSAARRDAPTCGGGGRPVFAARRDRGDVCRKKRKTTCPSDCVPYTHERSSNALMERTWAALLAREQPAKRYKRALCAARRRGDDGVLDGCACGCACDAASGECADPKARGVLPGWGLEMPYGATCGAGAPCDLRGPAPAPAFEGAMSHRATPRPPETVDVVVAAYDRPAAPMVASLLRALPYRAVHVRVFSYCKRAGGCAAGDAAALRKLAGDRGGRRVQIFTEQLPNVGRCDHTYLAHVARTYDDLANATFFLKDTTVWHDHLGAMANVLTFAAALPENLEAFCARRQGREARAFELPTYKSEQCARFGNCYADEAYARAATRPVGAWIDAHLGGGGGDPFPTCLGGLQCF